MSPHISLGQDFSNGNIELKRQDVPSLERHNDDEIHDLICVGFGPASLAIAVALQDAVEDGDPTLRTHTPKVRFIERQTEFAWHAGMQIPGSKMQITFIKDLATLRNPRSRFTFLNYLYEKSRLVPFTNLGTFLPERLEYEDYMRWCASHFEDLVEYNENVDAITAGETNSETGALQYFEVTSSNRTTGKQYGRRAKHVVIAVGGRPNIPQHLDIAHPRVIHSSEYETNIRDIFPAGSQPKAVAIIGGGQSAAEIFHDVPLLFPKAKSYLVVRDSALRPSDDSPFVNEIFDPNKVDDMFSKDPDARAETIASNKSTNYGVVRLELLEKIYSTLYHYRIKSENEADWPQQVLTNRNVIGTENLPDESEHAIRLSIEDHTGTTHSHKDLRKDYLDVDLVVVASGYKMDAHEEILKSIKHMTVDESHYEISRDYAVRFKEGTVEPGVGIWLQGCNESSHGISDSLLSILATRSGEMVKNIFGSQASTSKNGNV